MPLVLTIAKNATQHTQQMYLPHQLLIGVSLSVDFDKIDCEEVHSIPQAFQVTQ